MAVASWGLLVVAPMTVAAYVSPRAPFGVVGGKRSASASALKMATFGPMNCRPIGIGSATPKTLITNVDLESVVETSDEWIRSRTGIAQRRVLQHFDATK
eukprot:scaffold4885_cov50-Attheya_sp.AAC.1